MSSTTGALAVTVPDIGDFGEVPVIEVLVSVGDTVAPEDPLVTLESDKATMDVPSPAGGTVKAVHVKVGDQVSEGSLVLDLEPSGESAPGPVEEAPAPAAAVVQAEAERVACSGGHENRRRGRCDSGHGAATARARRRGGQRERRLTGLRKSFCAQDRARARRGPAQRRGQRPQGPPDARRRTQRGLRWPR